MNDAKKGSPTSHSATDDGTSDSVGQRRSRATNMIFGSPLADGAYSAVLESISVASDVLQTTLNGVRERDRADLERGRRGYVNSVRNWIDAYYEGMDSFVKAPNRIWTAFRDAAKTDDRQR